MIRCILFDVDDTLMDYHRAENSAVRAMFAEAGKEADEEILADTWALSWRYWDAEHLSDTWRPEVQRDYNERYHRGVRAFCEAMSAKYALGLDGEQGYERFNFHMAQAATLYDDTLATLDALKEHCLLCAATNSLYRVQSGRLRALEGRIAHLFCSETLGAVKPMPEFFEAVQRVTGIAPRECLMVGDSLTADIAGAARLGMKTAWVNRAGKKLTGEVLPDATIAELSQLLEIDMVKEVMKHDRV